MKSKKNIIIAVAFMLTAFVFYFAGVRSAIKVEQMRAAHHAEEFVKKENHLKRTIELQKFYMVGQQDIISLQSKQLLEMGCVQEEVQLEPVMKRQKTLGIVP